MKPTNEMTMGYLATAHFADCPRESKHFLGAGNHTHESVGIGAFDKASKALALRDCQEFLDALQSDDLRELVNTGDGGGDLWYTRNGDGVGFWDADRGWGEHADTLADIARPMGSRYVSAGRYLSIH
jgi:hypothetical protein